jgi:hypothetical protein
MTSSFLCTGQTWSKQQRTDIKKIIIPSFLLHPIFIISCGYRQKEPSSHRSLAVYSLKTLPCQIPSDIRFTTTSKSSGMLNDLFHGIVKLEGCESFSLRIITFHNNSFINLKSYQYTTLISFTGN